MKGELTILRYMRIADLLTAATEASPTPTSVTADTNENTITLDIDGTKIVLRPISINPVK